jgi:hypothetical protein
MTKNKRWLFLSFAGFFLLVGLRIFLEEKSEKIVGGLQQSLVSYSFDPRGISRVDESIKQRESEAFQNRIYRPASAQITWPGLLAFQRSIVWLQILQGVHNKSSYEGKFSWLFSKLNFLIQHSSKNSRPAFLALSPFYFLTFKDGPGSTFLMNSMLSIAPEAWRTWFWSGYHANENLKIPKLAGDLYKHAAVMPGSPTFLGPLSYRLSHQEIFESMPNPKKIIERDLPPELLRKIEAERPEWIK